MENLKLLIFVGTEGIYHDHAGERTVLDIDAQRHR